MPDSLAMTDAKRTGLKREPPATEGTCAMTAGPIGIMLASASVLHDQRERDASLLRAKASMGARIVKILEDEGLSVRQAEVRTGISHIEYSRIRQAKLRHVTLDRLMSILDSLGQAMEVCVTFHPRDPDVNQPALHSRCRLRVMAGTG
jgi:predicted XRE-type DNA-binding protein